MIAIPEGFRPYRDPSDGREKLWIPQPIEEAHREQLATIISEDNFKPDAVLGIARGGLETAQRIAYLLGVRDVLSIQTHGYDEKDQPLDEPRVLHTPNLDFIGTNSKLLIVDELIDEGKSTSAVFEWVQQTVPKQTDIRTAVVHLKQRERVFTPEYFAVQTPNVWLDYQSQADIARLALLRQLGVADNRAV